MNQRFPHFGGQYDTFEKQFMTADLSPRKYFRWQKGSTSLVLMDCPDLDSLKAFINVGEYLLSQGLSAPKILEVDSDNGFLLLEDFGDATFTRVLRDNPGREHDIYKSAVDVLVHLGERAQDPLPFLKRYTLDFGLSKVLQFLNHYCPAVMTQEMAPDVENEFINSWQSAIEMALKTKQTIFLKDYHVDNLMDLPSRSGIQNIGVLDFQDAVWAPVAGDLVSLLGDARREVSPELTALMWKRFLSAHPKGDHEEIYIAGCILSAVRHARILGLFTRVARERDDKRFLGRIPHLWNMLAQCCSIKELQPVKQWFDINMPQSMRVIPTV